MKNKIFVATTAIALLLTHVAAPIAGFDPVFAAASAAADGLPKPAISRALGALLLPDQQAGDQEIQTRQVGSGRACSLRQAEWGCRQARHKKAGDILVEILDRKVHKPIDVDVAVRRQLKAGNSNFKFDVERAGAMVVVAAVITLEIYNETYSVSELSSWETSTSFEEFVFLFRIYFRKRQHRSKNPTPARIRSRGIDFARGNVLGRNHQRRRNGDR